VAYPVVATGRIPLPPEKTHGYVKLPECIVNKRDICHVQLGALGFVHQDLDAEKPQAAGRHLGMLDFWGLMMLNGNFMVSWGRIEELSSEVDS